MNKIEIIGTRFTICISSPSDIVSEVGITSRAYDYKEVLGIMPNGSRVIYDRGSVNLGSSQCDHFLWLRRETSKNTGKLGILQEDQYKDVLAMALHYAQKISSATAAKRKTYYHGVLETLLEFSGSARLVQDLRNSKIPLSTLITSISVEMNSQKTTHGISRIANQAYGRYSITDFVQDLVHDGSKLIMDDSICKYQWQGRTTQGYGNIKPIIETQDLYPTYKITGIQGNQTNANLSIKFDFKANYDTGSAMKVLEVSRNLMVVHDGQQFQNTLALHVSDDLKKKLQKRGLIDATLPGQGDILVNIGKISVASRKSQRNRLSDIFLEAAGMYKICKSELERIEPLIQWTSEEKKAASEKAQASKDYWALNKQDRISVSSGKKIYTVSLNHQALPSMSQDQLRAARKTLLSEQAKAYNVLTSMIFNYLTSKKSLREYLKLSKKGNPTGKTVVYQKCIKSPSTGLVYTCNLKFA